MKRTFFVLFAVLALAAPAIASGQTLYVENTSTVVSDAELADALPAFQAALDFDFAPAWNTRADLVVGSAPAGAWSITLEDDSDAIGALGYHDVAEGAPYGRVFAKTSIDAGYSWTVTFSHELEELLADPYVDRMVRVQRRGYPFYMLEVGDPVEADQLGYFRMGSSGKGILLTDFITPHWFRAGSKGPWDFRRHTKRALQILPDGYQLAWSSTAGRIVSLCAGNRLC